ncbi:phosphoribosylglycinamide formyltransferase [bacterium]|nr:phosphoribosylglycinamide formyltransferase [bacterium]
MKSTAVVFISGRGSNLEALLRNQEHFQIMAVLSDRSDAAGLRLAEEFAEEHDQSLAIISADRARFCTLSEQKHALYDAVDEIQPDIILLAGYMQLIEGEFIARYPQQILNIHPSLLPDFPGLSPHKMALEAGVAEHGCTVHVVTEEVDGGPILAQAKCPVEENDTEESLAARTLAREHLLYPWTVNAICEGALSVSPDGTVTSSEALTRSAEEHHFLLPPR